MPVYLDTEKALPNEKLLALFSAVGWTTEEGAAEHAQHFNIPFCGSSYVVSAWDGDTLVGCARVLSDGAVRSVLYDLAVLPEYQGQGIGSTLLTSCIQKYPNTEWIAETTQNCIGFYEKFGFALTAAGEACVFMRRPCPLFGSIRNEKHDRRIISMVDFDLTKELLPGLPAYDGGRMSDGIYNAGDGFYDTRVIAGNPDESPLFCDGAEMTEAEFNDAVSALDRAGIGYHYQYAKGGIGLRIHYHRRLIDVRYCGGRIHANFVDDDDPSVRTPVYVRAVTETDEAAFRAYLAAVRTVGYQTVFEHAIEGNLIAELTGNGHLLHAVYTPGDGTARFGCDAVSEGIDTFGYQTEPKPGQTEIYQFGLYYSVMRVGFTCDCGMCYLIKLSDNALFFVDGGHYSQATEAATKDLWDLMHRITGTPMGEKIRIAGYFCTHAHNDHMDMFSHLIRLYHDEMTVERVMFNFVADEVTPICPEAFLLINRIRQYYPAVRFRKLHMGDAFSLADARFEVLQTHEDSIGAAGNEIIGGFNDTSTVLKVTFDGHSFLILGDIDNRAEDLLLRHYSAKTLHVDIVQCAHHVFNKLDRLYDVIDADWALVPQGERVRTNHDAPKYDVIARTVPYDHFLFSNQFTDGLRVNAASGEIAHHYHEPQVGGVYDGTPF